MHSERNISLIAWDLDNTLIDRDAALGLFFQDWLARHFPGEDHSKRLASIVAADCSGDTNRLEFCAAVLESCELPNIGAAALWSELQRDLPRQVTLDARVTDLLAALSRRYRMGIATNGGAAMQRAKIQHAGLERWFDHDQIFISAEIGATKPEPRFFESIADATRVPAEEILMVGDHPINDIRGAAACGWQTCWVSHGRTHPAPDLPVDHMVTQIWELKALLSAPAILTTP